MNESDVSAAAVGARLRTWVEKRFGDVKSFQREMERRGVKGSSQGAVYSYVEGGALPRLDFLEVAAEVLGVRLAWLAMGEEPATEGEKIEPERVGTRTDALLRAWNKAEREEGTFLRNQLGIPKTQAVNARSWQQDVLSLNVNDSRLAALRRFADKLQMATDARSPWADRAGKWSVLAGAAEFLRKMDEAREEASRAAVSTAAEDGAGALWDEASARAAGLGSPIDMPGSPAELAQWYDLALLLYAQVVVGLGAPLPGAE